ncbi:MAG: LPS export ABC transporter periplasmic protein LptC [Armatimonadota bacterium]
MRRGPLLLNIAILAVLFGVVIILIGRVRTGEDAAPTAVPASKRQESEAASRRIQLLGPSTVSRSNAAGEAVWEAGIKGDWDMDEVTGGIVGRDVSWRVVGEDLEQLQVIAGHFEADEESDTVHFADDVTATLPSEDATVTADEADYDPARQRLTARGDVVMQWRTLLVTGERLTADMVAHEIHMQGKVRGTYEG